MLTIRHSRAPVAVSVSYIGPQFGFCVPFPSYSLQRFRPHPVFPRPLDISVASIQRMVAAYYRLAPDEMVSARRDRRIARPRQVAMYLCRHFTKRSLPDIGRRFGDRDHTTVLHAVRQIEKLRGEDDEIERDVRELSLKLEETR